MRSPGRLFNRPLVSDWLVLWTVLHAGWVWYVLGPVWAVLPLVVPMVPVVAYRRLWQDRSQGKVAHERTIL